MKRPLGRRQPGRWAWRQPSGGESSTAGAHAAQVLFKVFSGEKPPVPADMPPDYRALMERCWAFEPSERPSFKEVKTELRRMLAKAQSVA